MTEKEVKDFLSINDRFNDRCLQVCKLLRPLSGSFDFLDTFEIDGEFVFGEGTERWAFGGYAHRREMFPLEYLWLKDDEIKTMVNKAVEDKERQIKERIEKAQREQLERKYKQYEDLKRQFE